MEDDKTQSDEFIIAPFKQMVNERSNKEYAEIITVRETVNARWSGVKKCCSGDRPQRNLDEAFAKWIENVKARYPDHIYDGAGHEGGTAHCEQYGGQMGVPRNCHGAVSVSAYAYFWHPENPTT